jgi:hypothetical protein
MVLLVSEACKIHKIFNFNFREARKNRGYFREKRFSFCLQNSQKVVKRDSLSTLVRACAYSTLRLSAVLVCNFSELPRKEETNPSMDRSGGAFQNKMLIVKHVLSHIDRPLSDVVLGSFSTV